MFSISKYRSATNKSLRSFGLVLAIGFFIIGIWPIVFRSQEPRVWALAISLVGLAGSIIPAMLRYPYLVWMFVGECLGWVNTRIILGVLYYLVVTPTRVGLTIAGHDAMTRKFDPNADTYRVVRKPRPAEHITHQF